MSKAAKLKEREKNKCQTNYALGVELCVQGENSEFREKWRNTFIPHEMSEQSNTNHIVSLHVQ